MNYKTWKRVRWGRRFWRFYGEEINEKEPRYKKCKCKACASTYKGQHEPPVIELIPSHPQYNQFDEEFEIGLVKPTRFKENATILVSSKNAS